MLSNMGMTSIGRPRLIICLLDSIMPFKTLRYIHSTCLVKGGPKSGYKRTMGIMILEASRRLEVAANDHRCTWNASYHITSLVILAFYAVTSNILNLGLHMTGHF